MMLGVINILSESDHSMGMTYTPIPLFVYKTYNYNDMV